MTVKTIHSLGNRRRADRHNVTLVVQRNVNEGHDTHSVLWELGLFQEIASERFIVPRPELAILDAAAHRGSPKNARAEVREHARVQRARESCPNAMAFVLDLSDAIEQRRIARVNVRVNELRDLALYTAESILAIVAKHVLCGLVGTVERFSVLHENRRRVLPVCSFIRPSRQDMAVAKLDALLQAELAGTNHRDFHGLSARIENRRDSTRHGSTCAAARPRRSGSGLRCGKPSLSGKRHAREADRPIAAQSLGAL